MVLDNQDHLPHSTPAATISAISQPRVQGVQACEDEDVSMAGQTASEPETINVLSTSEESDDGDGDSEMERDGEEDDAEKQLG